MAATAAQIAKIRRMVAEPATTTYSDALLTTYIEARPMLDALGNFPTVPAADGLSMETNEHWIPTYDLNAVAADIWQEKAATIAANYDFSAGAQSFQRTGAWRQAQQMAAYYGARRAVSAIELHAYPKRTEDYTVNE